MPNGLKPLFLDDAGFAAIQALLRRQVRGSGGLEVKTMPDGSVSIVNRRKSADISPSASAGTIAGLITGNAAGNGKYTGKSFTDITSDVSASGTLAASDCGTLAGSNDCLILNLTELGSSTTGHDLTAAANTSQFSLYFVGRLLRVNSDGTKVVQIAQTYTGC